MELFPQFKRERAKQEPGLVRFAEWRSGSTPVPDFWVLVKEELQKIPLLERIALGLIAVALPIVTFALKVEVTSNELTSWFCVLSLGITLSEVRHKAKIAKQFESPDSQGSLIVSISLAREGQIYGQDVGLLRFSDDLLVFEGQQTTFSFHGSIVEVRNAEVRPPVPFWKYQSVDLARPGVLAVGSGVALTFTPILHAGQNRLEADEQLRSELRKLDRVSRTSTHVNVLPPLAPSPVTEREGLALRLRFPLMLAYLTFSLGLAMLSRHRNPSDTTTAIWCFFGFVAFDIGCAIWFPQIERKRTRTMKRFQEEADHQRVGESAEFPAEVGGPITLLVQEAPRVKI